MPTSDIRTGLIKSVTKIVDVLFRAISQNLSSGKYPQELKDGVSTLPVKVTGAKVEGTIQVKAPQATAFEFGSGIWSTRGPRAKYPITPKEASMLAFDWPEAQNIAQREGVSLVNFGPGGHVVLPKVMHPGIQARPYIQPAIDAKADEIAEILADDILSSISEFIGPDVEVIQ